MEITSYLTECIKNHIPVSFSKYGDGEYYAAKGNNGANCDKDPYTPKLRDGVSNSFKYLVNQTTNSFIGRWHETHSGTDTSEQAQFWNQMVDPGVTVKWAKYHTIIMDGENQDEKTQLLQTIKESKLNKIIVCNELLIKSQLLLNLDHMVFVPRNNWMETRFESILNQVRSLLLDGQMHVIITCAGMASKPLIAELKKEFPENIYLDFGSAIDEICTKKNSRGYANNYDQLVKDLHILIPDNWNDPIYDYIYLQSKYCMGVHL